MLTRLGLGAAAACGIIAAALPITPALAQPSPLHSDSVRDQEHQLATLNVAEAWRYANGAGVIVAVIDSGVDAHHVDLDGQVLPGIDLVDPMGDADTDLVGHGTTVSAIIAGKPDADGIVGIAPRAKILPVRVLDRHNRYDDATVVATGVRWAVDHGARVINLSLGGTGTSATLAAAIDYAFAKDVVVVACTGNLEASPGSGVWYPAREPGVIAVAGLEQDGRTLWSGSITGSQTVVTAPASRMVGARPTGYWQVQGTSFAAPMVSATAALIRSRWPTMSAADVVNRIIRTAQDRGPAGRDTAYGFGMVDPVRALSADIPSVASNPLDNTPPPGIVGFGSAPAQGRMRPAAATRGGSAASRRVPGGSAAVPAAAESIAPAEHHGWWAVGALLCSSLLTGLLLLRRCAATR